MVKIKHLFHSGSLRMNIQRGYFIGKLGKGWQKNTGAIADFKKIAEFFFCRNKRKRVLPPLSVHRPRNRIIMKKNRIFVVRFCHQMLWGNYEFHTEHYTKFS